MGDSEVEQAIVEEPVVKKRRGRPPGSLNKSTIANRRAAEAALALDVDFSSEEVLGADSASDVTEGSRGAPTHAGHQGKTRAGDARAAKTPKPPLEESRPPPPKGKPKPKPRKPPPPSPNESPPPAPKLRRERTAKRVPEPLNPPTYMEVLQRGLKEARAKQYAEKVAQYDRFFQW